MQHHSRLDTVFIGLLAVIFPVVCAQKVTAHQYSATIQDSSGQIVGTLTYTVTEVSSGQCPITYTPPIQYGSYSVWDYGNFAFTETAGPVAGYTFALSGSGTYVQSPGGSSCPAPGSYPSGSQTLGGGYGFEIQFSICGTGGCTGTLSDVPAGYIDPRYLVATEVYAPPGPQSFVTYGSAQETGNTTSSNSSFTGSTSVSHSASFAFKIKPWHDGKSGLGGKTETTWTQQSSGTLANTNSWTTDLKTSSSYTVYGFPITWNGYWSSGFNPHDYDQAFLWLDPVQPFEATSSSVVDYGYGFDMCDPVLGLDIFYVTNDHLENGGAKLNSSEANVLNRGWATPSGAASNVQAGLVPSDCDGQAFASGGSALGPNDYASILQADPLLNESYVLNLQGPNYVTTGDGRYTRASAFINVDTGQVVATQPNTDFPFTQCTFIGCTPNRESYAATYTASSSLGTSADYNNSQTFGVDETFSASLWFVNFSSSLSIANKISTDYQTKTDITNSTSNYGNFTIIGAPCNPDPTATSCLNYAGPGEYDVYQDNKFGTFMFWPVQ